MMLKAWLKVSKMNNCSNVSSACAEIYKFSVIEIRTFTSNGEIIKTAKANWFVSFFDYYVSNYKKKNVNNENK